MTVRFATIKRDMTASVSLTPNCSRTRSPNPFGHDAHARRHLLDDGEGKRNQEQRPEQAIAFSRAHDGIGRDAACVISRISRDEPRADDAEHRDEPGAFQASNLFEQLHVLMTPCRSLN
jgi:hypothetical protein